MIPSFPSDGFSMHPQLTRALLDLSLAFRNVIRHRQRAAFALIIIGGGVIALLLASGFIQWVLDIQRESTIRSQLGHIEVVRPDYFGKGISNPFAYLLPQNHPAEEVIRGHKEVDALAPRLNFVGLLAFGDATLSFVGDGVDPAAEKEFADYVFVEDGERLDDADPTGVIVGQGLATNLGVKTGDRIVLMVSTAKGGLGATDAHIRGIFFTAEKMYDDSAIQMPITLARKLVKVKGATSWLVVLHDTEDTDTVLGSLRAKLDPKTFELVPWYDLADFYKKTVQLFSRQVMVVKFLIGMIIVLSISNTLSMAVVERTGEIGTAMALGVRRHSILRLFLMEGLVLGALGGSVGALIGWLLSVVISAVGIPMPPPPGMTTGFTGQITVNFAMVVEAVLLAVVTTLLASAFPAWKASRMVIVDALRHQR